MRLIINNIEVDLIEKDIIGKYTIANLLDFAPAATKTEEIELPPTAKNLTAFGNPNVLLNSSTIPFTLLDAQFYVKGIDMQVSKAMLVSYSKTLKVRLFGSNIDFFSLIKDKFLSELDMSALDHTRDYATIVANLNNTTGYLYPVIDYGPLQFDTNDIEVDGLFPSVHAADIIEQIVTDAGYTIAGDLITDAKLLTEIIPYSNKETRYITDEDALALSFEAANVYMGVGSVLQTFIAGVESRVQFNSQISGSNWDTGTYEFVAPRFGYYTFRIHLNGQTTSGTSITTITAYRKHGADPEEGVYNDVKTFTTTLSVFDSNTDVSGAIKGVRLEAGDLFYIKVSAGANNVQCNRTQTDMNISLESMNTVSYYLDEWITKLNLPIVKQSDFLKQYILDYACLISVNDFTKVVTIKKIEGIVNELPTDWSAKKDFTSLGVEFINGFAQLNALTYLDDENVIKPNGTDFNVVINNSALPASKDFIKSIFGATQTDVYLTNHLTCARIEVTGSNTIKPRKLIRFQYTSSVNIVSAAESLTTAVTTINIPYFAKSNVTTDLTYLKIAASQIDYLINLISTQRIVTIPVMLNEIDIAELNYLTPKYIDDVYLLVLEIEFNYSKRSPSKVRGIIL